jgi:hypothetical protein
VVVVLEVEGFVGLLLLHEGERTSCRKDSSLCFCFSVACYLKSAWGGRYRRV